MILVKLIRIAGIYQKVRISFYDLLHWAEHEDRTKNPVQNRAVLLFYKT